MTARQSKAAATEKAADESAEPTAPTGDDAPTGEVTAAPDPYDNPTSTTLDDDTTKPSTTAPGDGPADTTDPDERAQSVSPRPGKEALAAGTVNAVVPVPAPAKPRAGKSKARIERYTALRPDGTEVTIERNIDTGETSLV